jgi:hypothetical protein
MRKLCFIAAILVGFVATNAANAQVRLSASLNINNQPGWGPTGYDHVDYYYIPDVDAYYDVNNHQYVYNDNNTWVHAQTLPSQYSNYDPYQSYKVVVNQPNPWEHNDVYKEKYKSYKGHHSKQEVIRESRDGRYKEHWKNDDDRH